MKAHKRGLLQLLIFIIAFWLFGAYECELTIKQTIWGGIGILLVAAFIVYSLYLAFHEDENN
jgi:hypothetical protein